MLSSYTLSKLITFKKKMLTLGYKNNGKQKNLSPEMQTPMCLVLMLN